MNNETIKSLAQDIEKLNVKDENAGYVLCENLCYAFNTFGSYSEMMAELNNTLTETGKRKLALCIYVAAFTLAQQYVANGFDAWDLRNKASKIYAYEHLTGIQKDFERFTRFIPEIVDSSMPYYRRAINPAQWRGLEALLGFSSKWSNEHPTLQQAVFGGYIKGVAGYANVSFPFI